MSLLFYCVMHNSNEILTRPPKSNFKANQTSKSKSATDFRILAHKKAVTGTTHFSSLRNKLCTSIEQLLLNDQDLSGRGWLPGLLLRVWVFSLNFGLATALQRHICLSVEQSAVLSWTLNAGSSESREPVSWAANGSHSYHHLITQLLGQHG